MNSSFDKFHDKLSQFRFAYYLRKLIEGVFKTVVYSILLIFTISFAEVLINFNSSVRFILFLAMTLVCLGFSVYYIVLPVLYLTRILSGKADKQFCYLIQLSIPETKDNPVNILELSELPQTQLVVESINQKFALISNIDFNSIVKHNIIQFNKRSIVLSIILILSFVIFHSPITTGLHYIIHYSEQFSNSKSFNVKIDEGSLIIEQGNDLKINIIVQNNTSYQDIFISAHGNNFVLTQEDDTLYAYTFKSVRNSFRFNIVSEDYISKTYEVNVYESPLLMSYSIDIQYPKYVNKADTSVNNQNILIVPQGTFLNFTFYGANYDTLQIISLIDSSLIHSSDFQNPNKYRLRVLKNNKFNIKLSNNHTKRDFIDFNIVCVNDLYPDIQAQLDDSFSLDGYLNFIGKISDDYGFTKLLLFHQQNSSIDTVDVPIYRNLLSQQFFYNFYLDENLDFEEKNSSFWFEVYDNDAVNGIKKTMSPVYSYISKNIIEKTAEKEKRYNDLFYEFMNAQNLSFEIKNEIEQLRRRMLDEKLSDWKKTNIINQIAEKTQQLEEKVNQINNDYKQATNSLLPEQNKELLEKQQFISEMINSLLDDDMKKMLQEIQQMANNQNIEITPEKLRKEIENFEKSINMQYELLKKMKIEENILNLSDNLNMLSKKQEELLNDENSELTKEVSNQEKIFNELKEEYQNIKEENISISHPFEINDFDKEFENIENEFDNENSAIQENNTDNFKKSAKENAKQIEKLASELKKMVEENNSSTESENADDLRVMLDNLFEVSFELESIYTSMSDNNRVNQDIILRQTKMLDNFKMVRDSLYALSKRTFYLNNQISKSAYVIEDQIISSLQNMQEQNSYKAKRNQREALKQSNDMILLLSESLKDINNASGAGGPSGKKKKQKKQPDSKQSLSDMRKMQENLKNQMKNLLNQMKTDNGNQANDKLAKTLMQSEIYQQMIQQMMYNSDIDDKTSKILQEIDKLMQANHRDLANKNLSVQTILRQQKIMTKLLEAENSENEREEDKHRESVTAKNINRKSPNNLPEDYKFDRNVDLLNRGNLRLNSYYKKKYEEYINQVNTISNE